jgi:hypothetical protein
VPWSENRDRDIQMFAVKNVGRAERYQYSIPSGILKWNSIIDARFSSDIEFYVYKKTFSGYPLKKFFLASSM